MIHTAFVLDDEGKEGSKSGYTAGGREARGPNMGNHDRPQTTKSVLINLWSIVSVRCVRMSFVPTKESRQPAAATFLCRPLFVLVNK